MIALQGDAPAKVTPIRQRPGLVPRTFSYADLATISQGFAKSGLFKDALDENRALVKILAGAEWGLGPAASMMNVYVVDGKPTLGASMIGATVKKSGRYNYRVPRLDNEGCTIAWYENNELVGAYAFTNADAARAGLLTKDTYKKWPRSMYFARAISGGARTFCPDVFGGAIYTPDELDPDGAYSLADNGDLIPIFGEPEKPRALPAAKQPARVPELRELYEASALPGSFGDWFSIVVAPDIKTRDSKVPTVEERAKAEAILRERIAGLTFDPETIDVPAATQTTPAAAAAPPAAQDAPQTLFGAATGTLVDPELASYSQQGVAALGNDKMSASQRGKIMAMFSERGYGDDAHRHLFAAAHLGEKKKSSKTWTIADAKKIIDKLELIPPTKGAP